MKGALLEIHAVGLQDAVACIERIEAFASTHGISNPAASRLGRDVAVLRNLTVTRTASRGAVDVGVVLVEMHHLIAIAPTHDPARDKQAEPTSGVSGTG